MTFEDWFYEVQGYSLRAERCYAELAAGDTFDVNSWLRAAYEAGYEHGHRESDEGVVARSDG